MGAIPAPGLKNCYRYSRSEPAAGASVLDDNYTYDANGNVAAISDGLSGARGNRTMGYDGLDRLTSTVSPMFGSASYAYDVLDNLTRVSIGGTKARDQYYCYDASWHLTNIKTGGCGTGASVVGLGYDVQGNLQNKNGKGFTFDYGNRLRCANDAECYRYDGHGRRVLSWLPIGNILSMYGQDGVLRYQENGRTGKLTNYLYLSGSLVATHDQDTTTGVHTVQFQHTDALGSPVAVTDSARNVVERSEYEPYGQLLNRPLKDGPGFTGHVSDAASGLTYMQQRYFDPVIGRFLSADPVSADGGSGGNFSRYWYANNNPYKFTDPDGRSAFSGHLCDMGCDAGSFIAGDGRPSIDTGSGFEVGDVAKQSGTVKGFNDLPKLPDRVYTEGKGLGNSSGEGWERVERWTGAQEVRWMPVPNSAWADLPILNFRTYAKNSTGIWGIAIDAVLPKLKYAIQQGFWGMEYQVGYEHVYVHMVDGVYQPSVPVQTGYGTIWTDQTYWKTDTSQLFYQPRFKVGW